IQCGGPVLSGFTRLRDLFEDSRREHLLAEVALIERAIENRLVDLLELAQREGWREQLEADSRIFQLAAQPLPGIVENLVMVEGKCWVPVRWKPLGVGGGASRAQMEMIRPQQ